MMPNDKKKKQPRKISCLPCRTKKAKCDGKTPHCDRCIRNSRQNKCIYLEPRTFGRPPKNAVLHENLDTIMVTTKDKAVINNKNNICREFIFENQCDLGPMQVQQVEQQHSTLSNANSICLMKFKAQIIDIERIFSQYVSRGLRLKKKLHNFQLNPPSKMKSLHQRFTWLNSSMIHITIRRSCQFIKLESFYDPEITIAAFMKEEHVNEFFFDMTSQSSNEGNHNYNNDNRCNTVSNPSPMDSIPTDQSIQLIDHFFQSHAHCLLLNKTKVLTDFWNDSIEPLLLCVIYGIAIYNNQQALEAKAYKLWTANRNPFLNYAYILLKKLFLCRDQQKSSPSTLGNYQATVLLGMFESLYGFPKHGMTILSLSYMMASDLGVFKSDDSNHYGEKTMDPIDRELLAKTYWAALRCTAYGCVELGLYLREALLYHDQPFPPANIHTSASYQYDLLHNNHLLSSSYHIESFHTEIVVTYFSSKLFGCLPKTDYNMFGSPTTPANPPTSEELIQCSAIAQVLGASQAAASQLDALIDIRIQNVLYDFKLFIDQKGCQWSLFQTYMIETAYYLYCIHFTFVKSQNNISPIRHHKIVSELDLSDIRTASQIRKLLPTTIILIERLQAFLYDNDDLNDDDDFRLALLPLGLMIAALETTIQLLIYHYQLNGDSKDVQDQLSMIYSISKNEIWTHCGPSAKTIQKNLKEFLKLQQIPITAVASHLTKQKNDVKPPTFFYKNMNSTDLPFLFLGQHPMIASCSSTNFQASLDSYPTIDSSFLQEFDDIFQQAFDVNIL